MTIINLFNQIKRSLSVKKCIDCKHYYIPKMNNDSSIYSVSKCMKFLSADTDARGSEFEYAYIVRSEKTMCGPDGKYFQKLQGPPRRVN
jgi:hypothetical protein